MGLGGGKGEKYGLAEARGSLKSMGTNDSNVARDIMTDSLVLGSRMGRGWNLLFLRKSGD